MSGERMTFGTPNQQHNKDVCVCGDYREQHLNGTGRCTLNGLGHGVPGYLCTEFRIHQYAPVSGPANR
jgi:hypothetical protein